MMPDPTEGVQPRIGWRSVPGAWAYLVVTSVLGWLGLVVMVAVPLVPLWAELVARLERRMVTWVGLPPVPGDDRGRAWWRSLTVYLLALPLAAVGLALGSAAVATVGLPFAALVRTWHQRPVDGSAAGPAGWWAALLAVLVGVSGSVLVAWLGTVVARFRGQLASRVLWPADTELARQLAERASSDTRRQDEVAAERARMERALHDGAQLHLATTAVQLGLAEVAARAIDDSDTRARVLTHLQAARLENTRAVDEVRAVARGLRPVAPGGLETTVRDAVGQLGVSCTVDLRLSGLSEEVEDALALVLREAITNALRHANAQHIAVTGHAADRVATILVEDDGRGGVDAARGTGITGMAARVRSVDGRLRISSPPGGPTQLHITVPLGEENRT